MHHLCSKNTIPSKHNLYPVFYGKLHKNADQNNTFRAFMEAKLSIVSSQ